MSLDQRGEIEVQRAACGPRLSWWRFAARRAWARQLTGTEQRVIEQTRMDAHCQLLAMGSAEVLDDHPTQRPGAVP